MYCNRVTHTCTHTHTHVHSRLHFEARSPSPSSKFDFQSLPLIEHPDHNSPPDGVGYSGAPGNYQPISASELRLGRLPSSSDCREEAMSFSMLPTSQFALKPSTMDAELTDQQHSLLVQRYSGFDVTLEPYSWSWVRNARLNPLGGFRRTTDYASGSSSSSSGVHPSSAPSNYHSIGSGLPGSSIGGASSGSSGPSLSQQLPGASSSSSSTEPRDISRSSLSVTSSKTIILSNAPVSHAHPHNNPAAVKPNTSVAPPTTTPTSKVPTNQPLQSQQQLAAQRRGSGGANKTPLNAQSALRQRQDTAALQQTPAAVTKGTKKEEEKEDKMAAENKKATTPVQSEGAATGQAGGSSIGDKNSAESATVLAPPPAGVATLKKGESSSNGASSEAAEPMEVSPSITKKSSTESSLKSQTKADKARSAADSKTKKKSKESEANNKALSAWMMSKPAANILQLSRPRKRERNDKEEDEDSPKAKNRRTLFASADAALITSQFARQGIKKEEPSADTAQPLTVTHALNSAVMGIGARNALSSVAGLPITSSVVSSAAAAVSHNITKLPLSVASTTQGLSVAQSAAKLLAMDNLQQQQAAVAAATVNSVQDGVAHLVATTGQDKKTVVNAVSASGQAQALPGSLAVRRSSTGTNGTNSYQEIFHTERMKQALAG